MIVNSIEESHSAFKNYTGQSARNGGWLFEPMWSVPLQKDLISLMDLHEHCLSILAGVVVWMPCLSQLPIAVSYLLKRGFCFQWQYLQHIHSLEILNAPKQWLYSLKMLSLMHSTQHSILTRYLYSMSRIVRLLTCSASFSLSVYSLSSISSTFLQASS